ncbi:MAG TPA: hypothetical protein GX015_05380 [Corynebacterium sp.]|jgi:hypothetical protein|uniref:hypothetical protein n=1 Tax=Corynebacterium sp. TaxID=1720 RepID=UPI0017E36E06|nr:hypothetical protein [Corynebacterium sp.]MDY0114679.1 hypothetical protein [Corynebacterium sp.]HHT31963.1 hypothetical protein [Corynebacterium sp.]
MNDHETFEPTDAASIEVRKRIGQAPKPTKRTLFLRQFTPLQLVKAGRFSALIMSVVNAH